MSTVIAVSRSAPPGEHPPPPPVIAPTGNPGLDAVADVVNATAAPFQQVMDPELGTAKRVAAGLNGITGLMGAVPDLVDTGFAVLTAPIAKLFPALPAMTLLGMHVGPPHTHTHPPSLTPPAPAPVPLPSLGMLIGAGAVTVMIGGLPAARCGDIGIAVTCGSLAPPFEVFTGSSNVFIGGARAARMGDLTKHCNPSSGGKPGALDLIMNAMAATAGALDGNAGAVKQAAAETAVLGVKALMGKDPGLPMMPGALIGPPVPNVLIGGFPCPALGDMAQGKLLGGLKKALPRKKRGGGRKQGEPLDGKSRAQREANGLKCNGSHPIYLVTGENFDSFLDFSSGGLFEWHRHYTSARSADNGPLGFGWRHFYQRRLRRRLHRAEFTDWDGLCTEFGRFEPGETITRANGHVLERLGQGHFRIRYRGKPDLEFRGGEFDDELPLTRIVDGSASVELSYDELGRLESLVEVRQGELPRQFRLQLDALGRIVRLWQLDPRAQGAAPLLRAAYRYSAAGDLELAQDSLEGQARYEYDVFHRLTLQSDARRYAYRYSYDARGRCIEASGQDGLWGCRVRYFPEDRYTRYTEGDDATWEFHYDGAGVIRKIVDPLGGALQRRLDHLGRVSLEIDAGGRMMRWLYDADGAHHARVDEQGHLFLPESEQPQLPNPLARALPNSSLGWRFSGVIDALPEALFGVRRAALATLPAELDGLTRGCFRTRPAADGEAGAPERVAPSIELDAMGRRVREVDAAGRTRAWRYDATGNLIASIDRDGRRSTQETTSWNLTGARIDALGHAVRYEYSSLEQLVALTDPLGNVTRYGYDRKRRLHRVYLHSRLMDEYVYDAGDHLIEKRDGQGQVCFTNTRHANHLVAKRVLASGGEHRFDYDEKGRITEASSEAHEVRLGYDPAGRREADLRDGEGVEHFYDRASESRRTRWFERLEHRVSVEPGTVVIEHAGAAATRIEHPDPGLVIRYCSNGTTEVLEFDEEGRLEASLRYRRGRFGQAQGIATRYTYSREGDLLQVSDNVRGTTLYEVDAAHRLVAEQTPDGASHFFVLDPAGNLRSHPGLDAIVVGAGNRVERTTDETFEHDARERVCRRTRRDGRTTRYRYDSFDMLLGAEQEGQAWSAAYDALGRRLWTQSARERREFYWDGDRLGAEVLPDARLRVYQYASRDALIPVAFIEYADRDAPAEAGRTYHVFVDPVGLPLSIEDEQGRVVWSTRRTDPYGLLDVDGASSIEFNLRWPGHYFDPDTGLHYNRYRYYDPRLGRYLQSDPIGHRGSPVNLYAYCGNPLVQVDLLGLAHGHTANPAGGGPSHGPHDNIGMHRLPDGWQTTPRFDALDLSRLPPAGRPEAPMQWGRLPGGARVPLASQGRLHTFGSDLDSSWVMAFDGVSQTVVVVPRTGGTYQGPRGYPGLPADFDRAARSHLAPHADTRVVPGARNSATAHENFTAHVSHTYNERVRRTIEQRMRRAGSTWVGYNPTRLAADGTGASTSGGFPIPSREVVIELGPNGTPLRAWDFPNDLASYQNLPRDTQDMLDLFEMQRATGKSFAEILGLLPPL